MYFPGKLVYLIVRASDQLAVMLKCHEALLNISRDVKSHNALSLLYQQWNAKLDIRVSVYPWKPKLKIGAQTFWRSPDALFC